MPAEERRIVTILFSDIVGSTPIAEQLDPEEWREIVEQAHGLSGEIILAHRGKVLQYLGDGILAIFGADHPSERDSERAIRAALELVQQVQDLPTNPKIQMRAGVHTGLVVLGELGGEAKRELTASGDAMNLAQRLQSLAEPSNVVISHECYRYVRGLFDIAKQESISVKGRQAKVQPYIVQGFKDRPFRTVTRGVGGVKTQTVGRDSEMSQLIQALDDVFRKDCVIWSQLIAEPGVGKTRLLGDMTESLDLLTGDHFLLRSQALEGDVHRPYAMIRRMWFDRFQITQGALAPEVEARWVEKINPFLNPEHHLEGLALGMLLGLGFKDHPSSGILQAESARIKPLAFEASKELINRVRESRPLILLLEDLQWADRATWGYLNTIILAETSKEDQRKGMFILASARPEWDPPSELLNHEGYRSLTLEPLSDADSKDLIFQLLQYSEPLPEETISSIVKRSGGIPYYVEELINWLIDRGVLDHRQDPWRFVPERLNGDQLPQTLYHLLSTRMNALNDNQQQLLRAGAIFGEIFWDSGLDALGVDPQLDDLEGLEQRGFIQSNIPSSFIEEQEWTFHHNLMRDVAYESVLKRLRPNLHRAAAHWLEDRAQESDRAAEFAGMLGQHYELAGENGNAVEWYLQHDHVMNLVGEVEQRRKALNHTLDLAIITANPQKLAEVQLHRGSFCENLGDYPAALKCFEQAVAAAEESDDRQIIGLAQALMAVILTRQGQHDKAELISERALATLENIDDDATRARVLTNVAIFYTDYGDLGRGADLTKEQIEINHRIGERFGEAIGSSNLGYLYLQLGMFDESRQSLERAIRLTTDLEARRMKAYGVLNLGLALWRSGDPGGGQKIIHEQAMSEFEATQDNFGIGIANLYIGICYEANKDLNSAHEAYCDAYEALEEINVPGPAMDALAGLVRCEIEQGRRDQACSKADKLWAFLRKEGSHGMELPLMAYLSCGRVFETCGKDRDAKTALKMGYDELMTRAEKISDSSWRKSFLENIPEHRQLREVKDRWAGETALNI